jgi:hypothetical protein
MDPEPFARFIISRLVKTLPGPGPCRRAVAKTEAPLEGDDWFWTDDNAKVLELLSRPEAWRNSREVVSDLIDFVIGQCEGPLVFRRRGRPRFEIVPNEAMDGGEPIEAREKGEAVEQGEGRREGEARFRHTFMNLWCDLTEGVVSAGLRGHDDQTPRHAVFGGNYLRLRRHERTYTLDAEANIFRTSVEQTDDGVRLSWISRMEIEPDEDGGGPVCLGELTYVCTVSARSMFLDFECILDIDPGAEVSDVVLTFGCDQLSVLDEDIRYDVVAALDERAGPVSISGAPEASAETPVEGAAYWSIFQTSGPPGSAFAIHSLPGDPSRLSALRVVCDPAGVLHWVVSEHRFEGPQAGRIVARERKLVTSGGFYRDTQLYADLVEAHARAEPDDGLVTDLSVTEDYGAVLNGLACAVRTLDGRDLPLGRVAAARLGARLTETMWDVFDAHALYVLEPGRSDPGALFSRSVAFVALARAALARHGDRDRNAQALRALCDQIIGFERINRGMDARPQSGFVMNGKPDALPYVDCHAACLLALVRATEALGEIAWLDAIERGLTAFCLDTQNFVFHGDRKVDVVAVDFFDRNDVRHRLESFWSFKSGLCLQLFRAVRTSRVEAVRAIWRRHGMRLELLELVLRARLERAMRRHEDGIEILTSMLSTDTNSETQPWAALGLIDHEAAEAVG